MRKKQSKATRRGPLNPIRIWQSMLRRVTQRIAVVGSLKIPAVPGLLDQYVELCSAIFTASGRYFAAEELDRARAFISDKLREAYLGSQRSKIVIDFEAKASQPLGYAVHEDIATIADAYETWIKTDNSRLFGSHPDARVLSLAFAFQDPRSSPVLDLGAGTGRNALSLASRGHPVDAVELTPKFAQILATAAAEQRLPIRVLAQDVFKAKQDLRRDYRLLFASEVVPDFRGVPELRSLFELAADVLVEGGILLFNVHLCVRGFTPDKAAREFSQQCYSAMFTPSEVDAAAAGLPFEFLSNDSVYQYEQAHLPKEVWPPTPWFINWVSGLDVYDLEREQCPMELRWLAYKRTAAPGAAARGRTNELGLQFSHSTSDGRGGSQSQARQFNPAVLREALIRRLLRRTVASGTITFPAIPSLLDEYVKICFAVFTALGRKVVPEQIAEAKRLFGRVLGESFASSPRSNIVLSYEIPIGTEVRYALTADAVPLTQAYADWLEALPNPIFGAYPDARLLSLLGQLGDGNSGLVLDVGAGLGRNALYLASRGYRVDAVEPTEKFAERLAIEANRRSLAVRVIPRDVFESVEDLDHGYQLMLLSGTVGDIRELAQFRQIFAIAADRLAPRGVLLLNVHLAVEGYVPQPAAREWGQQCCAMFFTRSELGQAMAGLPLELLADDSAYDYEQQHLPTEAWPPTEVFAEWALGQHMYALDREHCPIELRWLVIRKTGAQP
jgi:SAM-dependent methyltransferase